MKLFRETDSVGVWSIDGPYWNRNRTRLVHLRRSLAAPGNQFMNAEGRRWAFICLMRTEIPRRWRKPTNEKMKSYLWNEPGLFLGLVLDKVVLVQTQLPHAHQVVLVDQLIALFPTSGPTSGSTTGSHVTSVQWHDLVVVVGQYDGGVGVGEGNWILGDSFAVGSRRWSCLFATWHF